MAAPAVVGRTQRLGRVRTITISQSGANDGSVVFDATRPLLSISLQLTGTYNSGTVAIEGSNGTTFVALPTAVSLSGVGVKSVAVADLGFLFYRVVFGTMHADNDLEAVVVIKEAL